MSEAAVELASPAARTRVLFVDDEAQILEGLQDTLRRWRREWDMTFVIGGALALEELDARPYDVIVSDMRMPGMDGATLLQHVQDRFPSMIRMILSGHSELESALRAAHVAHQFLAKPCDAAELRRVVDRTIQLRSLLNDETLLRVATGARTLPSVPASYEQLSAAIDDPEAPVEAMGELIEGDVAMCAKVLQLVNSAFFGLGRRIDNAREAAVYLGTTTLRSLVLSVEIFDTWKPQPPLPGFSVEELANHSARVAKVASRLAESPDDRESAFTAGLLHDVGKLLLATYRRDDMARIIETANGGGRSFYAVELELLGLTHTELGAYLLGLWGLPDTVVEAVAFHHAPERLSRRGFDPVGIVYVANQLVAAAERGEGWEASDEEGRRYVEEAGLADRLDEWRTFAGEVVAE
jgi:putative nucleotidyltransferase with HDIG domain